MNKNNKKFSPRDPQRTAAVKWVAKKMGISTAYVYEIISGKFEGGISPEIRKAYNHKYSELKSILL